MECKKLKPLYEYYSYARHSKKKGDYIYYHPKCKECTVKIQYEYNMVHREQFEKNRRKLYGTEKYRAWRKRANDKYRKNGKHKKWYKNNPEKLKKYNEERRNKNHAITRQEWEECKKFFNYQCAYCGIPEEEHKKIYKQQLHKEHVIHNGSNRIDNCVPACRSCNSQKWEFEMEKWYMNSEHFSEIRLLKIKEWLNKFQNKGG